MPSSKRPSDRWSSIAVCSATRAGWFTGGVMFLMPVPMWMRSVWPAMKPRNDSLAERCEYSSRKWCSVAQVYLKPARSAALVQLTSSISRLCSARTGSASFMLWCRYSELKMPNSMAC